MPPQNDFIRRIFERLLRSERFERYARAFRSATGLPLRMVSSDPDHWCLDDANENRSPFCERINLCHSACSACREVNRRLLVRAESDGPTSCHCFSGMTATAVPVRLGSETVAFLKTGQVFETAPTEDMFRRALGALGSRDLDEREIAQLREAYLRTTSLDPDRYRSMVDLLVIFAEQLGRDAEECSVVEDGREPEVVKRSIAYIHARLDERLLLGDVARHAGTSESHFCRLFKEATGLTFTDYVNHARIEWAKRELLHPEARISEVAFQVGYQSLSQFNRSFARITGSSPTAYRRRKLAEVG